jgi:hypothetical protein
MKHLDERILVVREEMIKEAVAVRQPNERGTLLTTTMQRSLGFPET